MAKTNFQTLDINMIYPLDDQEKLATPPIEEEILVLWSGWYLAWLDGGGALCVGFHGLVNGDVSMILFMLPCFH